MIFHGSNIILKIREKALDVKKTGGGNPLIYMMIFSEIKEDIVRIFSYYYHLYSSSFQKVVCSRKQVVIVFISYFFMGNKLIIFPFKGKMNIRSELFSLANVIRKCRNLHR